MVAAVLFVAGDPTAAWWLVCWRLRKKQMQHRALTCATQNQPARAAALSHLLRITSLLTVTVQPARSPNYKDEHTMRPDTCFSRSCCPDGSIPSMFGAPPRKEARPTKPPTPHLCQPCWSEESPWRQRRPRHKGERKPHTNEPDHKPSTRPPTNCLLLQITPPRATGRQVAM